MFYIQQIQKDDCGFACLKMVLATVNKDKNYLFLPQDENHKDYSFNDLIKIASKFGIDFTPFKATEKESLSNCSTYPFIAVIIKKNDVKHAVVVTKVKHKRVYYTDPSFGPTSISLTKFLTLWDGTGLLISEISRQKCPYEPVEPIKAKDKIVIIIVQFISMALAFLGVYFVNDKYKIFIPVLFFMGAFLMELIMKSYSLSVIKGLDSSFFDMDLLPKKDLKGYYIRFEEYKKMILSSSMNYVVSLVFSLALVAIILLNDKLNYLLVAIPILLAVFEVLFFTDKKKNQELSELEDELELIKDKEEFINKVNDIHKKAYSYGFNIVVRKYSGVAIMLCASILTMFICKITSFPYIIFNLCLEIALYKSINQSLTYNDSINELNKIKVRLNNCFYSSKENK